MVHGNFTHGISVMKFFITKDFTKMNLLRLIPILVVVTCQLDDYDPFEECPYVLIEILY